MSFSIKTSGLPIINSYAKARFHWNDIRPIQGTGRNRGLRPLADRRATHMTLVKRQKAFACRLYKTDCVTFYENGDICINYDDSSYNTVSTRAFINAIMGDPRWGHSHSHSTVRSLREGDMLYTHVVPATSKDAWLDESQLMQYAFGPSILLNSAGVPYNPDLCVVHRVNRKAMNSVRKLYAPFMAYAKNMIKIGYAGDVGLDLDARSELLNSVKKLGVNNWPGIQSSTLFTYENADFLCRVMRHDDKADWAEALQAMAAVTMTSEHRFDYRGQRQSFPHKYFFKPHHMIQAFMDAPKYAHRDQVFVREELPLGEYKPDNNEKYLQSL